MEVWLFCSNLGTWKFNPFNEILVPKIILFKDIELQEIIFHLTEIPVQEIFFIPEKHDFLR